MAYPWDEEELAELPSNLEDVEAQEIESTDYSTEIGTEVDDAEAMQMAAADPDNYEHPEEQMHIQSQEVPATVKPDPTAERPATGPAHKYNDMLGEYKKLLDERQKGQRNLGILAGVSEIAQGVAGRNDRNYKTDVSTMMKVGETAVNQPVEDYSLNVKQQGLDIGLKDMNTMRDPSSTVSQFYREMAKKRGLTVTDNMSAWDLSQMGKIIGKPESSVKQFQTKQIYDPDTKSVKTVVFDTSTGKIMEDGPIGTAGYAQRSVKDERTGELKNYNPAMGSFTGDLSGPSAQTPEQAATKIPEITKEMLPVEKQKQLDVSRKEFLADTKDERASLQAAKSIKSLLTAGKALDGDIMRAVQNKFSIATGNKGATSENDVTPFGGRQAILDRISRQMNFWVNGEFTDDDRKFLNGLAGIMEKTSSNELKQSTQFFSNNLYNDLKSDPHVKVQNMTPASVEKLLGTDVYNTEPMVAVIEVKTGKRGSIPQSNVEAAIKSKKYQLAK